jgi:hypothetical protein
MLRTIAIIILLFWLLDFVASGALHFTAFAFGGLFHLLIVVAVVIFIIDYLSGRTPPVS